MVLEEADAQVIPEKRGVEEGDDSHQISPNHIDPDTSPKALRETGTEVKCCKADYVLTSELLHGAGVSPVGRDNVSSHG